MPAQKTVTLFVHGANQADKDENKNTKTWEQAFNVTQRANSVLQLVSGQENASIDSYHQLKHQGRDYPQYIDWTAP